jgi:hypothetical protein
LKISTNIKISCFENLGMVCNSLGNIYGLELHDIDRALPYWQQSNKYKLSANNRYHAGLTHLSIARALFLVRRADDALAFARAAKQDFQSYGSAASKEAAEAQRIIDIIQDLLYKLKELDNEDG